jgi:hypothetical protein
MPSARRRLRLRSYHRPATGAYATPTMSLSDVVRKKKPKRRPSVAAAPPRPIKRTKDDNDSSDDDTDASPHDDDTRLSASSPKRLVPDLHWSSMFARLLKYKRRHGDTIVPQRYERDIELGLWVK